MKAGPKRLPKTTQAQKDEWIKETQMFQRIAKVEVSTYEELAADWDSWNNKARHFSLDNIRTNRVIQDMAGQAGKERKS